MFTIELKQILERLKTETQTKSNPVAQTKINLKCIVEGEDIQCTGCKKTVGKMHHIAPQESNGCTTVVKS